MHPATVTVGHPVDVVSGTVFTAWEDFVIPGRFPIVWRRFYSTAALDFGPFGKGWVTPYTVQFRQEEDSLVFANDEGELIAFPPPEPGSSSNNPVYQCDAWQTQDGFRVFDWHHGIHLHFHRHDGAFDLVRLEHHPGQFLDVLYMNGRWSGLRDPAGRSIELEYSARGLVTRVLFRPLTAFSRPITMVEYEYDAHDRLTKAIDRLGHAVAYKYDSADRLVRETGRGGFSFHFAYDEAGRCSRNWSDGDRLVRMLAYDLPRRETAVTDGTGATTTYANDGRGLVVAVRSPLGSEEHRTYDPLGRLVLKIDPLGHATRYIYDDAGHLVETLDPGGGSQSFVYDPNHNCIQRTDETGSSWVSEYDAHNNLRCTNGPLGDRWTYDYDDDGNLVRVIDARQSTTSLTWDHLGQMIELIDGEGGRYSFEYDPVGNVVRERDPAGLVTSWEFDDVGNRIATINPDGSVERTTYDAARDVVTHTDSRGGVTRFTYTLSHSIASRVDELGHETTFHYDIEGRIQGITNELGETMRFSYDQDARLVAQEGFDGRIERFAYDRANHLIEYCNGRGEIVAFEFDGSGSLVGRTIGNHDNQRFEYDKSGRLIAAVNRCAVVNLQRDQLGRVIRETINGVTVDHEFDPVGNRVSMRLPSGRYIRFTYDRNSLLAEVTPERGPALRFRRAPGGRERERAFGSSVTTAFAYDRGGRLTHQRVLRGSSQVCERRFSYDPSANPVRIEASYLPGEVERTYDLKSQLVRSDGVGRPPEIFEFDAAGNLRQGPRGAATYLSGNRLLAYAGQHNSYDGHGNPVRRDTPEGAVTFAYDPLGQLVQCDLPDGTIARYDYDALGRRIAKQVGSARTEFIWTGRQLLVERTDEQTSEYVFAPAEPIPLLRIDGEDTYLFETDHIGTVLALRTASGEAVWTADYRGLGEVEPVGIPRIDNRIRFQGQYADIETQLHYNLHRYYDPQTGRFLTQDPHGIRSGTNLYRFAPNPFAWVDPLGLFCHGGSAAETLPRLGGKSVPAVQAALRRAGFVRTNPANPLNQTWRHPDGSVVMIHAYGNAATVPYRSGNNAHVHRVDPAGNRLDDRGHPSPDPAATHIGIKNPPDLPAIRGRPHGEGTM